MALPGFEGRLGRLGFLGRSIGLGLAMGVATVVLTLLVAFGGHASPGLRLLFVAGIVGPVALYAGLSLQVRRLNDMGWPALPVIGGWFLVGILDVGLAHGVPALARPGGGTVLGAVVNVVLALLLLLWPGRDEDDPIRRERPPERIVPGLSQPVGWPGAEASPAPVAAAGRPASFGRRRA